MVIKLSNWIRRVYEKFNIYIYILLPLIIFIIYNWISKATEFKLENLQTFSNNILEIFLSTSGILLTVMGLFISLPDNNFRKLLKKYNHDKIVIRSLFIGVIVSLLGIILTTFEILAHIQVLLFIIALTESFIATTWIYMVSRYINS